MPLPENWNGIFYSADTGGDLLYDLTPDDFAIVAERSGDDPAFLFAGAHFDMRLHGDDDRAAAFLAFAKAKWPEAPWSAYEMMLETCLPDARGQHKDDDRHRLAVCNAVSYLFTGVMIL
ncbi:MAG TPA: hypothetical protein VL500_03920 [Candidatus Eisenbacteria bacterium]|jgi:hypothetical protein|nr:hypothetical protein [Candidatus Eisenbacteria bacterium]